MVERGIFLLRSPFLPLLDFLFSKTAGVGGISSYSPFVFLLNSAIGVVFFFFVSLYSDVAQFHLVLSTHLVL